MGDVKGFLKVKRKASQYRQVCERIKDYSQVTLLRSDESSSEQASRCMDCGTPFCHWACPLGNYIPEWNDYVFTGKWKKAVDLLNAANPLPEITGRVCPALCEYACVLGINDDAVTIRENELAVIEAAFQKNLIKPHPPKTRSKKKIAVVGSGPAGLSAAGYLNKLGHNVVVFERDDKIGGILRYGIPDFKLEKSVLDRRIKLLQQEGIKFKTNIFVGEDYSAAEMLRKFDALCLTCGSRAPRDLNIEGRNLSGIHFAMDYLIQANKRVSGIKIDRAELIDAKAKKVVVIGGGDTGANCVGIAHRQGASCIVQIELLAKPPASRLGCYPWPAYPLLLKTSTSHEEGGERLWSVVTKKFVGEKGKLTRLTCARVEFKEQDGKGCSLMRELPNSEFDIEADLIILAVGFLHPEHNRLVKDLKLELDPRGNIKTNDKYMSSHKGVFSAGDMHRGQSLVVWAIFEGLNAACSIDEYLDT